jgi:replication factor A2
VNSIEQVQNYTQLLTSIYWLFREIILKKMSGSNDYMDDSGGNPYAGYGDGGGPAGGGGGYNKSGFGSSPDKKSGGGRDFSQPVTPVTGAIIRNSPVNQQDDSITVDTRTVSKVILCGRVVSAEHKTSFTEYTLDDGTGLVKVVKTNNEESGLDPTEDVPVHAYMKVYGVLRTIENELKVNGLAIRLVTDHNEFTHHMLSVAHTHYVLTRGPLTKATSIGGAAYGMQSKPAASVMAPVSHTEPGFAAGIDADSRRVHDVIARDNHTDMGPSIQEVARALGFPLDKVRSICQNLTSEGFIYSTIDDDHYKSTGSVI